MSKAIAEYSNAIKISYLKKNNFIIPEYKDGSITSDIMRWTCGNNVNSIELTTNINGKDDYIKLRYTHTDHATGEKENINSKISLTTTPCYFGNKRYWFICPLIKNGKYCGRRVGVIYSIGKYYGCRHCGEIAYSSQNLGGRYKGFVSVPDVEKAEKEIKRYYYKGQPTKKYKKYLKLSDKLDEGFIADLMKSNKKLRRQFAEFRD